MVRTCEDDSCHAVVNIGESAELTSRWNECLHDGVASREPACISKCERFLQASKRKREPKKLPFTISEPLCSHACRSSSLQRRRQPIHQVQECELRYSNCIKCGKKCSHNYRYAHGVFVNMAETRCLPLKTSETIISLPPFHS